MIHSDPVEARYFDGKSARSHAVEVRLDARFGAQVLVVEGYGTDEILWPTSELREMTEQARDEGIVLSLGQDGIARLIVPHGEKEDLIRSVSPNLGKRQVSRRMWRNIGIWAGGAVAAVLLIMFVIVPGLANTLAGMLPVEREVAIGNQAIRQISRFLGGTEENLTCTGGEGQKALEKMTARLVARQQIDYPLDVRVFDHGMVNAFAVPGGHVVLFDGLLKAAASPEEVAGVLAHELGHVVNRDPTRLTLRTAGSVGILGMVFGDFAGGALALVLAEQLISASYSQDAESEADRFAHETLAAAELPTEPLALFFQKLKDKYGDSEGIMSHLASHPDLGGRAAAARAADTVGEAGFEPILTEAEWTALKAICK